MLTVATCSGEGGREASVDSSSLLGPSRSITMSERVPQSPLDSI